MVKRSITCGYEKRKIYKDYLLCLLLSSLYVIQKKDSQGVYYGDDYLRCKVLDNQTL